MKYEEPMKHDSNVQTVVPGQRVRLTGEAACVVPPQFAGNSTPTVQVVSDGNQIRAIDVRCACGRRIHLNCEY